MPRLAPVLLVAVIVPGAACSPAREPTAPAVIIAPSSGPDAGTCRIAGPSASLTVAVNAGGEELAVMVRGAPVTIIPRGGGASAVEVTGALAFAGHVEGIELFPSAPVLVAGGVVQLGPMSVLQDTSPRGTDILARSVDIGPPFQLSEVTVPCSMLSFVGSGDPAEDAHRGARAPALRSHPRPDPCVYDTTPEVLDFHEHPGEGAHVRLTGSTVVSELEHRGPWTRVATQDFVHMDGAQLTGWVEQARLTRIEGGIGFSGGRSVPSPLLGESGRTVRATGPGVFHGLAHIDAGTAVFTLPTGGVAWATVRDGMADFEVFLKPGDERADILRGPSLPGLRNAWVPRAAVHPLPSPSR
jgi:hypothetical protein